MAFFLWGLVALGLGGVLVFSSLVEFAVPALAALVVLSLSWIPWFSDNLVAQTVLWLALTGVGMLLFRDRLKTLRLGSRKGAEDSVAGRTAKVVEAIGADGTGRVRFLGTTWKATSAEPAVVGAEVLILGQDGIVLQVEPLVPDRVEEEFKALEARGTEEE